MSSGIEAAGDAITGAVVGRAVEPSHGESDATVHGACLNCGATLIGSHCHQCGQAAHVHRTLGAYGHDIAHGVFHFEGKIWRTLPMLAWKPGELTRRYIHGERAKFVSPLALFLFSVFLMFAIINALAGEMHTPDVGPVSVQLRSKPLSKIDEQLKIDGAKKSAIDAQIKKLEAADGETNVLEKQRDAIEKEINDLGNARDVITGNKWTAIGGKTGWAPLDTAIANANENPNLLLYKLQSSAYKYSWALIPLSVPFVWLLFFWKSEYKLYDHAIFVTYSLTFMMFLVVILTSLGFAGVGEPFVPIAGVFIPPLHMYRQIRGAYRTSRAGAIIRTFALAMFGLVVLVLFMTLLIGLGLMG